MNTNRIFYILVGLIAIAIFVTVILVLRGVGGGQVQKVNLEFWGVFDDSEAFTGTIKGYQALNPAVKVFYRKFAYEDYEKSLIDALAAGTGPDMFMIGNTWLPKHGDKLKPLPAKIAGLKQPLFTLKNFQDQFVEVAYNDLIKNSQIYAMPLYADTLALYYNKDLFNTAGITRPPSNWEEFNSDVELLTKLDANGNIIQSGAAIGTAKNINRSTDILMALMIQSGVQMTNAERTNASFSKNVNGVAVGETALKYYTDFANPRVRTYTWNDAQHYSIDALVQGETAMMFNYAHQAKIIKAKAPRLNFGIVPIPQISSADIKNYANYLAAGVSNASKQSDEAWKFIAYLTSKEGAAAYLNATLRPSARRDLIDLQRSDIDLGLFAVQALTAKSWYEVDSVSIETIFADMIDDVNFGRYSVREALTKAESKVTVLMSQKRRGQ